MFNKMRLENYKGYQKLELEKLQRVNLIAGMNNTGKTSILEAIYLHYDRMAADVLIAPLARRGVQQLSLSAEYIFHPYFHNFNTDTPFKITIEDSGHKSVASYAMISPENQHMAINNNSFQMNSIMSSASIEKNAVEISYSLDNKSQGKSTIQIVNNQIEMQVKIDPVHTSKRVVVFVPASARGNSFMDAQFMSKIDMANGLEDFISYLKMIEPRLRNVSLLSIGGQPTIYVDVGLKRKIPIVNMGEGISKLTSILTAILSNQNAIILIDEIENGIHYSLMSKIWEIIFLAATKQNCQIFSTTHSNDVIKGISDYFRNPHSGMEKNSFEYIRLDRNKEGIIIPKYYDPAALVASVEREWDVR